MTDWPALGRVHIVGTSFNPLSTAFTLLTDETHPSWLKRHLEKPCLTDYEIPAALIANRIRDP